MPSEEREAYIKRAAQELLASSCEGPSTRTTEPAELSALPVFECFNKQPEFRVREHFERNVRPNDLLLVKVRRFDAAGVYVNPMCTLTRFRRCLDFLDLELLAPLNPLHRRINLGDRLVARIIAVQPISIEIVDASPAECAVPAYFSASRDASGLSFWKWLQSADDIRNNRLLEGALHMPQRSTMSFLRHAVTELDRTEDCDSIRQQQDHASAMILVKDGIKSMREGGDLTGVVGLFTKAIDRCATCSDAYVARGAAQANAHRYEHAVSDFEKALEINKQASNAVKYLKQTLFTWADDLTKEGKPHEAAQKLSKVLEYEADNAEAIQLLADLGHDARDKRQSSVELIEMTKDGNSSVVQKRRLSQAEIENAAAEKRLKQEQLEQEKRANREKLREFERLIAAMKGTT